MSPRRIPRPGDPDAPKFWLDEAGAGGHLAIAVRTYLVDANQMTLRDIALMRAYLSQWIQSPVWDMNPGHDEHTRKALADLRAGVGAIVTPRDVTAWLHAAAKENIDPL